MVTKRQMRVAVRKSIEHWYQILNWAYAGMPEIILDIAVADNCSLCLACGLNRDLGQDADCAQCPVANKVQRSDCIGTPYGSVKRLAQDAVYDKSPTDLNL